MQRTSASLGLSVGWAILGDCTTVTRADLRAIQQKVSSEKKYEMRVGKWRRGGGGEEMKKTKGSVETRIHLAE